VPIELDVADLELVQALADGEHSRVTELFEQLPEDDPTAVRERIIDDHSYTETAAVLNTLSRKVTPRATALLGDACAQTREVARIRARPRFLRG
jgi:DNA-directed RNA polymerase specialized sigma24 family protein